MLQKTTHIISPAEKLRQVFAETPDLARHLADNFKRMNPDITCWDDLKLEKAAESTLNVPQLDHTLQRPLIVSHKGKGLCGIINNFKDSKVATLRVFHDADNDDAVLTWDGQHTLLALYFIAVYVLEIDDLSTCAVPVAVHPSTDRAVIRESFLGANGDDKTGLSPIDHFEQEVHSVRVDENHNNEDYNKSEETQTYLDEFDLFLVNDYEDHAEEYGAMTRHNEVTGQAAILTRYFGRYRKALGRKAMSIQPKEQWMMYEYFRLCEQNDIKLTAAYMKRLAKVFKDYFNADFSADDKGSQGEFWAQAKEAYLGWHAADMKNRPIEEQCGASFNSNLGHGIPFLLQQLKALNFKGVPEQKKTIPFTILKEDLWK